MAEISELQSFLPLYDRLFGASKGESSFPLVIGRDVAYVFPAFLSQARFGKSFASPQIPGDLPRFEIQELTGGLGLNSVADFEPLPGFLRYYHAVSVFHTDAVARDLSINIVDVLTLATVALDFTAAPVAADRQLILQRSVVVGDGFRLTALASAIGAGAELFLRIGRYQCRATEPLPSL